MRMHRLIVPCGTLLLSACIVINPRLEVGDAELLGLHADHAAAQAVEDHLGAKALDSLQEVERHALRSAVAAGREHALSWLHRAGHEVAHLLHLTSAQPERTVPQAFTTLFPATASAHPALRATLWQAHRMRPTSLVYTCRRDLKDEEEAHREGRSQIDPKRSAHVQDPAMACDRVPFKNHAHGSVDWEDLNEMHFRAGVEAVALEFLKARGDVDPSLCLRDVEDWKSFADPLHVEIGTHHCVLDVGEEA